MPAPEYLHHQAAATFQAELNELLLREEEWDGALVTVVGVDTSRDSQYVTAKVSVLPVSHADAVIRKLKNHSKKLAFLLNGKLGRRRVPELRFEAAAEEDRPIL